MNPDVFWRIGIRLLALALATSVLAPSLSADEAVPDSVLRAERPSVDGKPTNVEIGVYVLDLEAIEDVKQHFSIDMFVVVRWQDPRLALPAGEDGERKRLLPLDEVWSPRVLVLNNRGLSRHLPDVVEVDESGNVEFQNRVSGELATNLQFEKFPFDTQRLPIDVVSYDYTTDEMQFSPKSGMLSRPEQFSIEGWNVRQLEPVHDVFLTPAGTRKLPRLTFALEAKRDADYYVFTMLVPMSLIIFMAWTVFWIQPSIVPSRIAISTASIFSLIALGVSIRLSLPKISYLTKADHFVLGCTLMVFLALGIAVISSRWANSDREAWASRANSICRWVYLLVFLVVAIVAIYV